MKTFSIALSFLAFTSAAFAASYGTPDQDPIVKDLRSRFSQGTQPIPSELIGKTFKCKEIDARRDDFKKNDYQAELSFTNFDGYLQSHFQYTQSDGQLYALNGKELIGSSPSSSGTYTDAFRIDTNGYLLNEWSYNGDNLSVPAQLSPIASAAPRSRVVSYSLCVQKL